jgi:hypothetical protein
MSYDVDMPAAARKNIQAADLLDGSRRRDVAGYLYGLAAECAVKAMMVEAGIRLDSLFYLHFPELNTGLRDRLQGRRGGPLNRLVLDLTFMSAWNIKMRYAKLGQVADVWVDRWREQARRAVNTIGAAT